MIFLQFKFKMYFLKLYFQTKETYKNTGLIFDQIISFC